MPSLAHDLLRLMLNLSRVRDRERMIQLFGEALGQARPGLSVRWLRAGEGAPGEGIELATAEASFGRIVIGGTLTPDEELAFRNAIPMLAVLLENASREERLASENARLDAAVGTRTAELKSMLAEITGLYENAPCGYHSLAPDGTILGMNETELRWLGYARDEVVGSKRYVDLVAPRFRPAFESARHQLGARGAVHELELELVRRDGTVLPVLLATALRSPAGDLLVSRATVIELTERRRAEEQLRQALKLEAMGRLAGGVAHDFNNLLTVILSAAGALLEGLAGHPLSEEAAEIELAAKRAAALTRQLLTFGRRQRAEPQVIDLGELVGQLEKMLRRLIAEHVELVTVVEPGLHRIRADPGQLEQVIVNLAVNARDAMPAGGRLTLEARNVRVEGEDAQHLGLAEGEHVVLLVRDTGSGMDEAVRSHLFEPFFTTKQQGTGLGLSTVYGIVKECGGEIRVDTAPGKGATFAIYLPPVAETGKEQEASGVERVRRGSERVLLVEDEPAVRRLALRTLKDAGYDVLDAADGEEALRVAGAEDRIDVLVTDVVMPRVGGAELAERIRERRPGVKVLLVSGYARGAEPSEEVTGRGYAFLAKPFTPAALARTIRELLDAPAARAAGRAAASSRTR
jgi:two-component system cell cycle sensor histidine kinase/response regulator CckA